MNENQKHSYLGNDFIKKSGVQDEWTLEKIEEYKKCSEDPLYFIENYIKAIHVDKGLIPISLYSYQREMITNFHLNRYNICLLPRQAGKTTAVASYLLWFALFNPEKTIVLLANKGETSREILSRILLSLENIPFFLQCGVQTLNKGNIDFANKSRIIARATSNSSVRGISASLIYIDEMAFIDHCEKFWESTYPVISSGKTTKIILTSTANGQNLFYKIWIGAKTSSNDFVAFQSYWWDVPGRDEAWKIETIRNTSEAQFRQEYENEFVGSANTLIDANKLLSLSAQKPIYTLDGNTIRVYREPIKDHSYIMTVDVSRGRGQDYSTFNVIDVTASPFEQVCVFQDNMISPLIFPNKIEKYAKLYNEAFVVIESNDNGVLVCNSLFYDLEYDNQFTEIRAGRTVVGAEMTRKVKSVGCSNLKDLIEEYKLILHDKETIQEVCSFVANGRSYEAEVGTHDDLVMNLVMFAWFSSNESFRAITDIDIKERLYEERIKAMEEELLPFGVIDDGRFESLVPETFGGMAWQRI